MMKLIRAFRGDMGACRLMLTAATRPITVHRMKTILTKPVTAKSYYVLRFQK